MTDPREHLSPEDRVIFDREPDAVITLHQSPVQAMMHGCAAIQIGHTSVWLRYTDGTSEGAPRKLIDEQVVRTANDWDNPFCIVDAVQTVARETVVVHQEACPMTEHRLFDEFGNDSGVVIRVGIDPAFPQDVDVLYHPPGEGGHWWFGQDDGSYQSRENLLSLAKRLDALRAAAQQADPAQVEYLDENGSRCPNCNAEQCLPAEGRFPLPYDCTAARSPVTCLACGATWSDEWELTGFADLTVPPAEGTGEGTSPLLQQAGRIHRQPEED